MGERETNLINDRREKMCEKWKENVLFCFESTKPSPKASERVRESKHPTRKKERKENTFYSHIV